MLKVQGFATPQATILNERENNTKVEKSKGAFFTELVDKTDGDYQKRLEELFEKINEQGAKLSQNPTYAELKSYRELVKNFMSESINRAYLLESSVGWDYRGRQKMYTVVKKVDSKLAELAEDVRIGQEKQLSIMEKLEVIKGMLVDMYT